MPISLFSKVAILITLLSLPRRRNRRFRQYVFNGNVHAKALIQKKKYELTLTCVRTITFWRRRRDSNPCGVAAKRFSRPPRYDRFDTPPYFFDTISSKSILSNYLQKLPRSFAQSRLCSKLHDYNHNRCTIVLHYYVTICSI